MDREEQLVFCKQCVNRKLDMQQGLVCDLTGKKADFVDSCDNFEREKGIIDQQKDRIQLVRPNKQRAVIAQTFVWAVMIVDMISAHSSYLQYNLLIALQDNEYVSDEMLDSNDTREQLVAIVYLIVFIISIVTFIQWFRRAYYNLGIRKKTEHAEGWAAGCWFVPIISLYWPYKIMKEMWVGTNELIRAKTTEPVNKATGIIGVWWAAWIISNYIGNYFFKSSFNTDTIEDLLSSTQADLFLSIIGIPLAIITVMIIKQYSFKEEKLRELERSSLPANE